MCVEQTCPRPEVVEVWDVTSPDPRLLVWLKVPCPHTLMLNPPPSQHVPRNECAGPSRCPGCPLDCGASRSAWEAALLRSGRLVRPCML